MDFINENPSSHIQIHGNLGSNNIAFFTSLYEKLKENSKNILFVDTYHKKEMKKFLKKNSNSQYEMIIFASEAFSFEDLENFLNTENIIAERLIFSSFEENFHENISKFSIPSISFREYSENFNEKITMKDVLGGKSNFDKLKKLSEEYLASGSFIENIANPEKILETFSEKCDIMSEEIFEKEKEDFENFIRTVAMNVGSLFKEDHIAKNMNISRRKVAKYLDILLKYQIITAIESFCHNPEKELSRHKKYYFSDLSYYKGAMGQAYGMGNSKTALMENFIFLELSRKITDTHHLFFWKKKSGTELAFVLENKETQMLSPIEVDFSVPKNISQTMKSFYESYGDSVEYGMFLNENQVSAGQFQEKSFLTLPFYTV